MVTIRTIKSTLSIKSSFETFPPGNNNSVQSGHDFRLSDFYAKPVIIMDTTKMKECGNDIMALTIEIGNELDALFDRIANIPVKSFEWTGEAANLFAQNARKDKVQYMKFKDDLYNKGKLLVECASNLEANIGGLKK